MQINLNTATNEEILMIPGMGKRMLREFQEYRPYKTLAQFRKEIGKYVDRKVVGAAGAIRFRAGQSEYRKRRGYSEHSGYWVSACSVSSRSIVPTRI